MFQTRRLVIAVAIGLVLALGQGSLSLAYGGCDNADHAEAVQQLDSVASPIPRTCGDDACTGAGCCGTGTLASCCHSGSLVLGDRLASTPRLPHRTAWMLRYDSFLTGTWPEVGRHPPRLSLLAH